MEHACRISRASSSTGGSISDGSWPVWARLTNPGIDRISVSVIPFVIVYVLVIVLISLFPDLVTFRPNLVYG